MSNEIKQTVPLYEVGVDTRDLWLSGEKYPLIFGAGWAGIIYQRHTADEMARKLNSHADLLAACERFVTLFEGLAPDAAGEDLLMAVTMGKDAIAKARGT